MNSIDPRRRGLQLFPVVLLAAAIAAVVVAALTTWWVLLALIPLTMMLGCVTMMATHGRMRFAGSAGRGCCPVSPLPRDEAERAEAEAPHAS